MTARTAWVILHTIEPFVGKMTVFRGKGPTVQKCSKVAVFIGGIFLILVQSGCGRRDSAMLCFPWFTPEARVKRAKIHVRMIRDNRLATHSYADKRQLLDAVKQEYIDSDIYLACAYHDLAELLAEAHDALDMLDCAYRATKDRKLVRKAKDLTHFVSKAIPRISDAMNAVRDHVDYAKHLRIQEQREAEQERLELQRERLNMERERLQVQRERLRLQQDAASAI